jgi:hypothetical protein
MLLAIICVLGAAWSFFIAARPEVGFFLEEGWKFRDAEPSDLYLGVTRFGAAVAGIACLAFAAVLAFGGPGGGGSGGDTTSAPENDDLSDAVAEGFDNAIEQEEEVARRVKEECQRLEPLFERTAKWDAQNKLTNPDAVRQLASEASATITVKAGSSGDTVHVATNDKAISPILGRTMFLLTSAGTVCMS